MSVGQQGWRFFGILGLMLLGTRYACACEPPLPPVHDVVANMFYSDTRYSIIDAGLYKQYLQAVKPIEDAEAALARLASRAQRGDPSAGSCTGVWLAAWAREDAMLGNVSTMQAQFVRKWATAAFAMDYVRTKLFVSMADRAVIEPWLIRLADQVDAYQQARFTPQNNHLYWDGYAVGAVGMAVDSVRLNKRASDIFDAALVDIQPDGHLPAEAARGVRAWHYHDFSILPLVMLAEIAAQRGESWYERRDGALHRLIRFTLNARRKPELMAALSGVQPEPIDEPSHLGWLPLYARRFPERVAPDAVLATHPFWVSWAGGDMNLLATQWIRPQAPPRFMVW